MLFLLFVRILFWRHWLRPSLMRTDETSISNTRNRAYQTTSEKQTGFSSRSPPSARYTRIPERFQPPDYVPGRPRYRTYSTKVTSESPSNLPLHRITRLCWHTRFITIPTDWAYVKKNFVQEDEFFCGSRYCGFAQQTVLNATIYNGRKMRRESKGVLRGVRRLPKGTSDPALDAT